MQTVSISAALCGEIRGTAWAGFRASMPFTAALTSQMFAKEVAAIFRRKSGDFQSAYLAQSTCIELVATIRRGAREYVRRKAIPIRRFKSLRHLTREASATAARKAVQS